MFDMPVDGVDDVSDDDGTSRGGSNSLLIQSLYSAGSHSSPPSSISPLPDDNTSLNYHPFLDGEFSPHLA
jgi:hypothetical protein